MTDSGFRRRKLRLTTDIPKFPAATTSPATIGRMGDYVAEVRTIIIVRRIGKPPGSG